MRQVFLNLIINAADAVSAEGKANNGKLLIQSSLVGETPEPSQDQQDHQAHLQIMFIDNGPGISEENIANIFDPFYTTKEPGKGTGLGLSVSFMIIEGFGGKMTVSSKIGEGTTMTLLLPVIQSETDATEDEDLLDTPLPVAANSLENQ